MFKLKQSNRILNIKDSSVGIDRNYLTELLQRILSLINFDEDYYRKTYKDLRDAEIRGEVIRLYAHYMHFGFFENRLPCAVEVDAAFYVRTYPDVGAAILEKRVTSCQVHFETTGFAEGRLRRKGWRFSDLMRAPSSATPDRPPRSK